MKKTHILYLIIFVLLGGLAIWQSYNLGHRKAEEEESEKLKEIYAFDPDDISSHYIGMIVDTAQTAKTYDNVLISVGEVARESYLVARLSATGCRPCIDNLINELLTWKDNNPDKKVTVIVSNTPLRDMLVWSKQYQDRLQFLSADSLSCDFQESESSPYIMRLDESGRILSHFICRLGDKVELHEYLISTLQNE